jgi:hypothetical protein
MHRVFLYLLLPAWLCFSVAYAQFNSFPPGVFTNKAAHDPAPAAAGVTLNAVGAETHFAAATTAAYTNNGPGFTVASGDTTLVATFIFDSSTGSGLTATWDVAGANQAMADAATDATGQVHIFCLQSPTPGVNKTITFGWTGSQPTFIQAATFKGSSTGCQNGTSAIGTTTVTVTSAANHIVLGLIASGGSFGTLTSAPNTCPTSAPTCIMYSDSASGIITNAASEIAAGSASVAIGSSTALSILVGLDIAP